MRLVRVFNGKEYRRRDISYSHKSSAKKEAKKLRDSGKWNVRVVGEGRWGGYAVFTRPKTKMHRRKKPKRRR